MLNNLTFAITRPKTQGLQLQQALKHINISSICQPLFDYQENSTIEEIEQVLAVEEPDVVIFVSAAAVEFANNILPLSQWLNDGQKIIAVGEATYETLKQVNINAIYPTNHTSEGLLTLSELSSRQLQQFPNVLIVRGDGGREYLSEQLKKRQAKVTYLECYRRVWYDYSAQIGKNWQHQQVNGVIITSNALLKRVSNLVDIEDNYWKKQCLWLVASDRILGSAMQLGLQKVINTHGASNKAIIKTLQGME